MDEEIIQNIDLIENLDLLRDEENLDLLQDLDINQKDSSEFEEEAP